MNLVDNSIENEQESMEQSEESDNGDVTAKETQPQSSDRAEVRSLPASIRKLDEDSSDSEESVCLFKVQVLKQFFIW